MAPIRTSPLGALLLAAASAAAGQTQNAGGGEVELPHVTVSGRPFDPARDPASIAEFTDRPLWRTPLSVTVITPREMRDAGARGLSTAIRGEPAATDAYNTVGFIETLQVRGFVLDNTLNYRRNGLPVSNYVPFARENKQVQIMKGLQAAIAGTSSPGGLVNYLTTRPSATSLREIDAEISERGTWTVGADLSERAGPVGYRFNVATEERRPNARDAPGDRRFASGAFELKLPRDGVFEFELEWQRARQISVPAFGLLDRDGDGVAETLPPPIDPRINLNDQPWSQPFESRSMVGTARYEQAVGQAWRAGVRALAQRIATDDRIAFPDGCSTGPAYVYPGLCGNYDVDIYDFRSDGERRTTRATEVFAIGRFKAMALTHRLNLGARATRYAERFPPAQAYNFVGTTNVFAPVVLPADASLTVVNKTRDLSLDEAWLYDEVELGAAWAVWLGARYVEVENRTAATDGSESAAFGKNVVLPWFALAWEPWTGGTFYASTGSGIEAEVVPNRPADFANPGQALPVGRSRQVEVGYKQGLGRAGFFSVALFEIRKPFSGDVAQPAGPPLRVADGRRARHRGAEVEGTWFAARSLSLDLRATYLDAKNDRSIDAGLAGKRVTNVPNFAASFATNLRPTDAVDLQWRNHVRYTGTKAVTTDNAVELPATWQWDTALLWSPEVASLRFQVRAGVDNVTNRRYWREAPTQPWGATYLFAAQPRTYRVGVSAQW